MRKLLRFLINLKKKLVAGVYKTDFTESFDTVFNPRILKVETKGIF